MRASGEKAAHITASLCPLSSVRLRVDRSQRSTLKLEAPTEAKRRPSGDKATPCRELPPPLSALRSRPEGVDQTLTRPSRLRDTSRRPSGEKLSHLTPVRCPRNSDSCCCVFKS